MNKKLLIILPISILICSIGYISLASINQVASPTLTKIKYAEPKHTVDIPASTKWNPDLGEYYNSDDFVWNNDTQRYDPIFRPISQEELNDLKLYKSPEKFILENANTNNEIDRALINYYNDRENAPHSFSSYLTPENDTSFHILTELSVKNIPEMIKKIETNYCGTGLLESAVNQILKVNDLDLFVNGSPSSDNLWMKHLDEKKSQVKAKVKEISENLKNNNSAQNIQKSKQTLNDLGMLSLPYLLDEIDNGNENLLQFLPDLTTNLSKDDKTKVAKKDKAYWQGWTKEHSEDIKIMKQIIETN